MQGHFKCINGVTVYYPPAVKEFFGRAGTVKIDCLEIRRKRYFSGVTLKTSEITGISDVFTRSFLTQQHRRSLPSARG
jgi:hypothetical protein